MEIKKLEISQNKKYRNCDQGFRHTTSEESESEGINQLIDGLINKKYGLYSGGNFGKSF